MIPNLPVTAGEVLSSACKHVLLSYATIFVSLAKDLFMTKASYNMKY